MNARTAGLLSGVVAVAVAGLLFWAGPWRKDAADPAQGTEQPLQDYGKVPAFSLTEQSGASFGSADLLGRVWVANSFFTYCQTVCPPLMAVVHKMQQTLDAEGDSGVRFVSISVDPESDVPERLRWYEAHQSKGNPARWKLLTGGEKAIRQLVVGGFHTAVGDAKPNADGVMDITHSAKLFVVDRDLTIRGYFSTSPDEIVAALSLVRRLMAQEVAQ